MLVALPGFAQGRWECRGRELVRGLIELVARRYGLEERFFDLLGLLWSQCYRFRGCGVATLVEYAVELELWDQSFWREGRVFHDGLPSYSPFATSLKCWKRYL